MSPESDRFKHDYQKYADEQVRTREHDEAMSRLRMAFFMAALGPVASIVIHTIKWTDPPNLIRYGILLTSPLAIALLIAAFIRLPAKAKGSGIAVSVILFTILAAAGNWPLAKYFSLTPT